MQLRALLLSHDLERGGLLKQSLLAFGHDVVVETLMHADLLSGIEANKPDLLVIDSDTPSDELLSRLRELLRHNPLPVVLFAREASRDIIHKAVHAGVSACVVDGLERRRVGSILDVAIARFSETERLRRELESTRANLLERKAVERAKGILMKQRGFDEPQAYHALRKMAMDKNLRIGEVAANVSAVADLLN
jgi:response regulator NasT